MIGDSPSTSALMKRPVANGTAMPAIVCTTRSGEYTNITAGDDKIVAHKNRVRLKLELIFSFDTILNNIYTKLSAKSDNKPACKLRVGIPRTK